MSRPRFKTRRASHRTRRASHRTNALALVVSNCMPNAKIVDLCEMGDSYIREETSKIYKKGPIKKGIAFPTCLSVNNTVCHFSPLATDESVLEPNDVVKIDMGCHIDGFIAVLAHTHVITNGPVTGRAADVLAAANKAAEVALRLVRPGKKEKDVSEAVQKVAAAYNCNVVGGAISHQLKRFFISDDKFDQSKAHTKEDAEFQENEVYAIDITMSTGEGKPKLLDEEQATIYKKWGKEKFAFTARALEESRLTILKSTEPKLLKRYHVLHEEPGDLVAHIKFTVVMKRNRSERITSHPLQELRPMKCTEDNAEIHVLLALGMKTKKRGGKKEGKGLFVNLNCEMLFQIFLRLEPKWVFCCGSVCKNWHNVISDATFLQQRYQRQQQRPLLLRMGDEKFPYFRMDALDLETLKNHDFSMVLNYDCQRGQWANCFKIHGSCNCVLLLSFHEDLYLCNPITRHWSRFAYTSHNNQSLLCLYHNKESSCFRILKKEDNRLMRTSYYFVVELEPGISGFNPCSIGNTSFNEVVDLAPVQVRDSVF